VLTPLPPFPPQPLIHHFTPTPHRSALRECVVNCDSLFHFYVVHKPICSALILIIAQFLFHISITVLNPVLQKKNFHLNVFLIGQ
jgi:hypothetical protein